MSNLVIASCSSFDKSIQEFFKDNSIEMSNRDKASYSPFEKASYHFFDTAIKEFYEDNSCMEYKILLYVKKTDSIRNRMIDEIISKYNYLKDDWWRTLIYVDYSIVDCSCDPRGVRIMAHLRKCWESY